MRHGDRMRELFVRAFLKLWGKMFQLAYAWDRHSERFARWWESRRQG